MLALGIACASATATRKFSSRHSLADRVETTLDRLEALLEKEAASCDGQCGGGGFKTFEEMENNCQCACDLSGGTMKCSGFASGQAMDAVTKCATDAGKEVVASGVASQGGGGQTDTGVKCS